MPVIGVERQLFDFEVTYGNPPKVNSSVIRSITVKHDVMAVITPSRAEGASDVCQASQALIHQGDRPNVPVHGAIPSGYERD